MAVERERIHEEPTVMRVRHGFLARGTNIRFAVLGDTEAAARERFTVEAAAWHRLVESVTST